jgi:hypothetical protein
VVASDGVVLNGRSKRKFAGFHPGSNPDRRS